MIGDCTVKNWSKTRSTIALSSGEAELAGIGAGMTQARGMGPLAENIDWKLKVRVHSDATVAIGISKRWGSAAPTCEYSGCAGTGNTAERRY